MPCGGGLPSTDVPGLHCAMGEAFAGSGGYFGSGRSNVKDCLDGGYGVAAPFTLIWGDADVARQAPADVPCDYGAAEGLSCFEGIGRFLEERYGVTVVLE
ncbi:hypothetical protein AB0D04_11730 [Streptomyces sp. NPDC048483]|uniref:hypothetical protein n=1 Tax=Streptomyces sp. NPDC048483 TaxID=3154927 RepID=UPI0034355DCA